MFTKFPAKILPHSHTSKLKYITKQPFSFNPNQIEFQKVKEPPPYEKILIANRGEISCRIQKTCHKMGIKTIVIHSEADANGLFVQMADEAICVGPPPTAQSYLQIERIVNACKTSGAQAVHPGFGFLSENNLFAKALEDNNIVFIGPRSHAISVLGDKISSKEIARKAKVSIIPGENRVIKDVDDCVATANRVGYPVMVKASGGGGGKGMRIAYNDKECRDGFRLATNEAKSSFNDDRIFIEKFVEEPRHVEFQVLADKHGNTVYLNERECSIQRRNQKVYEEAPSPCMTPALRKKMGEQACSLAKAVDYITAGTCEFLVDKHRNFYFLEMNTRLQVEHPITEMITGIDIVEQMIRISANEKLPFKQSDIPINGWAIEARVYAEDPFKNFLPSIGKLTHYREPFRNDPDVRIDSGIQEGAEISTHYDPMISKTIVHAKDRNSALEKMKATLDSYVIHGLNHNVPFLRSILDHPKFVEGDITTKFIQEYYPGGFSLDHIKLKEKDHKHLICAAASCYLNIRKELGVQNVDLIIQYNKKTYNVNITREDEKNCDKCVYKIKLSLLNNNNKEGEEETMYFNSNFKFGDFVFYTNFENDELIMQLIKKNVYELKLQYKGLKFDFNIQTPIEKELMEYVPKVKVLDLDKVLLAPMPGNVYSISIKKGQNIIAGQEVCIIEAMKMQNLFFAQKDGIVKEVYVKQGQTVQAEQVIYELE